MPIVERKATAISNADADMKVITTGRVADGMLRESVGGVAVLDTDLATSVYRLVRVPANARLSEVTLVGDDLGVGSAADIGVYYPTHVSNGDEIDDDFFAAAESFNGGVSPTDLMENVGLANLEKPLWDLVGLSDDPHCDLDIVATVTGAPAADGIIAMRVRFTQ